MSPEETLRGARTTRCGIFEIARSRCSAALTAIAFVLASLIGLVHEATTRHVQCAEHGEQIHGATAATGRAAPDHSVTPEQGAAAHGHEHCLLASATRASRLVPVAPAIATRAAAVVAIVDVPTRAACAPTSRVYRTAPKTSPPA